ncbi:putative serinePthreonine-protein phosphatase 7 long form [Cardamine amara subsp. amara]|uniref:SerinePthreonine-protein phosphatase 7 long form n=1 Tax=Cardamine amara subsp. amara TaxID=228776 RepID=A0ABD1BUX8_CARAN
MENASSENENHLIEEREEVMVSEKGHCLRKFHFLQPYDGSVAELPHPDQGFSVSSSELLKIFSLRSSFSGFWVAECHFIYWVAKMEALHAETWKKAGIFEAIKASTYNITKNSSLILSISEKWCPQTKSFVFPWGEATITLEDVMVLLGFSVLGSPVFSPLGSSEIRDSLEKLQNVNEEIRKKDKTVRQGKWISSFFGRGDQMEHEAFLALWLSFFVFPGKTRRGISKNVFPIAVRLARGERIALAPAVLAKVYRDLDRVHDLHRGMCHKKVHLKSLFKLVQVWTWERFSNTSPTPKEIPIGEPRISRWNSLKKRYKNVSWSFDDFEWRPYTTQLKNWNPLLFYLEEAMWLTVDQSIDLEFASFARCVSVSQLVGNGFVEGYFPNRVARQFGLDQDLPGLVTHYRNFTEKEAWDDYSKSLDGLNIYMPSRLDRGSVTAKYQDWWLKSVSEFMGSKDTQREPTETYNARNRFDYCDEDDDDDDDASPKVLPLSQVVQKLEQGFPAKCRRSRMRRLVNRDKVGELVKSLLSSGWKRNKTSEDWTNKKSNYKSVQMKQTHEDDGESSMDEEDDGMTIAQRTRSKKKYSGADKSGGDGFETLGKRTRRYVAADSDDDSEPCEKLASVKIEQRSEEDDETARKAQKTRRICDDFEVDANGNTAEKRTMIYDEPCNGSIMQSIGRNETKKAECLVHEDGEKKKCNERLYSEVKKVEEIGERLKQRKLAIKEIELNLEARMIVVEKTLAKIRKLKNRENRVSA